MQSVYSLTSVYQSIEQDDIYYSSLIINVTVNSAHNIGNKDVF